MPTVYRLPDWYADVLYPTELTFAHSWSDASRSVGLDVRKWVLSRNQFCDDDWLCDSDFLHWRHSAGNDLIVKLKWVNHLVIADTVTASERNLIEFWEMQWPSNTTTYSSFLRKAKRFISRAQEIPLLETRIQFLCLKYTHTYKALIYIRHRCKPITNFFHPNSKFRWLICSVIHSRRMRIAVFDSLPCMKSHSLSVNCQCLVTTSSRPCWPQCRSTCLEVGPCQEQHTTINKYRYLVNNTTNVSNDVF